MRRRRRTQTCRAGPGFTRLSARQALRWRRHLLPQQKPADFAAEPRRVYNSRYSTPDGVDEGTAADLSFSLAQSFPSTRCAGRIMWDVIPHRSA